jgi:hypothetical protein
MATIGFTPDRQQSAGSGVFLYSYELRIDMKTTNLRIIVVAVVG